MTTTDKTLEPKEVRKIIDAHPQLSRALAALYLEVEASIAEDIETKVAQALQQERKALMKNMAQLGQWLNEDRITDPKKMVTMGELKHWLLEDK